MIKRIFIILICFYGSSCYAQSDKSLIENWKSYPIPTNTELLSTSEQWDVTIKGNQVYVIKKSRNDWYDLSAIPFKIMVNKKEQSKMFGKPSILKVDDGYLIGFNRGEFGGHLFWFSNNGKKHYEIMDDDRVVQFFVANDKYFAIEGLAHLRMSEGEIVNFEKHNGKWKEKQYLKLPEAPDAIALDSDNDLIVITSKGLLKVNSDKVITSLVEKGMWYDQLDANSLVIKDNIVYAGMLAGVYKYDLSTGKQEWLLPY